MKFLEYIKSKFWPGGPSAYHGIKLMNPPRKAESACEMDKVEHSIQLCDYGQIKNIRIPDYKDDENLSGEDIRLTRKDYHICGMIYVGDLNGRVVRIDPIKVVNHKGILKLRK